MDPKLFVKTFYPHAQRCEQRTGIPAIAVLAQAALESSWGKVAPGNMFFGVKDTDGVNGNEQLLITTEYSRSSTLKFPEVLSVKPVILGGQKYFKYTVKDYFRRYNTAEDCFVDHANFFLKNKRYSKAIKERDPFRFIDAIAAAGYATDPNYAKSLKAVANSVIKRL